MHVLAALGASSAAVLAYVLLLVIQPRPPWRAQYALAYLGFVLASALPGVSAGLACVVEELSLGARRNPENTSCCLAHTGLTGVGGCRAAGAAWAGVHE